MLRALAPEEWGPHPRVGIDAPTYGAARPDPGPPPEIIFAGTPEGDARIAELDAEGGRARGAVTRARSAGA